MLGPERKRHCARRHEHLALVHFQHTISQVAEWPNVAIVKPRGKKNRCNGVTTAGELRRQRSAQPSVDGGDCRSMCVPHRPPHVITNTARDALESPIHEAELPVWSPAARTSGWRVNSMWIHLFRTRRHGRGSYIVNTIWLPGSSRCLSTMRSMRRAKASLV